MKTVIVALIIWVNFVGCHYLNIQDSDTGPSKLSAEDDTAIAGRYKLRRVAANSFFIHDFILRDREIIGIGLSEQNKSENIFISDDEGMSWHASVVDFRAKERPNLQGLGTAKGKIWLVGSNGLVLDETSTPRIWNKKPGFGSSNLKLIDFAEQVGYAVASVETGCQIFQTVDSGQNWKMIYANKLSGNPFDLLAVDRDTALLAMNDEYVLRTDDKGKTWLPSGIGQDLTGISAKNLAKLDRVGASDLELNTKGIVWITGEKGSLFYSNDKGKTWQRPTSIPFDIEKMHFNSIAFSEMGRGIAVGNNGTVIVSQDGGANWEVLKENRDSSSGLEAPDEKLIKVKFDGERAVIMGDEGVYEVEFPPIVQQR
ncbi:hypothetical protein BH10ACI2_BH10ACI2_00510 [soil metagenome]